MTSVQTEPGTQLTVVGQLKVPAQRNRLIAMLHGNEKEYVAMLAQVSVAVEKLPKLAECTEKSIVAAVSTFAALGADINKDGWLIPYRDKGQHICTPVFYFGYITAMVQMCTGYAPVARNVWEGDYFDPDFGSNPVIKHKPWDLCGKPKGKHIGTYAYLPQPGGRIFAIWIPADELEAHRKKFSHQWKDGEAPEWYHPKTALKRLCKTLPKTPKMARLHALVDRDEIEDQEIAEAEITSIESATVVEQPKATNPPVTRTDGEVLDDSDFTVEDEPADGITLAMARAMRVNGEPGQFNGMAGKRLDECSDSFLVSFKKWCYKKIDEPGGLKNGEELIRGVQLVQEARAKGELQPPAKTPPVGSETSGQLADRLGKQRETAKAGAAVGADDDPFA